ncbi:choice-of-anchor C domain-containing protein [Streptomyces sp. 840.1]|uniref:choice-of-anchor C family protein n=1 Tax=Streptomyces sp. 840.1 TaxID=2485152 RepID=UPI000F4818CC|nr:choice-of-anchor C family protein [Streptomyces sp. 840.1]ROQ68846.1 choice-of-anchor C domain-containing protein [Streptomyces sp. 840.1]
MRVSRSLTAAAAAASSVLLVCTGTAVAAPSHFDDGSFEYPVSTPGGFRDLVAGQSIGPWQVTSGSVDHMGAGSWQAAEGDQSVDLSGVNAGTVAQTFTTVPGRKYSVTYALAGNPAGPPVVKSGKVLVNGQNFQDFTFDITGRTTRNMGYVYRQVNFVATNSTTTLGFASSVNTAYGPVVDDVTVVACPPCPTCG